MRLVSSLRSIDTLHVLKHAGATGVLIGIEGLSYRSSNFSIEQIQSIIDEASRIGLEVYLQCNRMIEEEDLPFLNQSLTTISSLQVAGIYFQDLAYVTILKKLGSSIPRIYAPEAMITNTSEVGALLHCGIDRVVLAKELTLEEILHIAKAFPNKVELFGFGHRPMSFSRRPMVKNYLDEIGKDPMLAQGYDLRIQEAQRQGLYPILEEDKVTTIFDASVFCALRETLTLQKAGVHTLIAEDLFLPQESIVEYLRLTTEIQNGLDPQEAYKQLNQVVEIDEGFFHQKTNATKVEVPR